MLVNYVYDYCGQKNPVACIVCTGPNKVGVSICSEKDQFNKKLAKRVAMGRAETGHCPKLPNRSVIAYDYEVYDLKDIIHCHVHKMEQRANRYFK